VRLSFFLRGKTPCYFFSLCKPKDSFVNADYLKIGLAVFVKIRDLSRADIEGDDSLIFTKYVKPILRYRWRNERHFHHEAIVVRWDSGRMATRAGEGKRT
jgi:hypothetical protein